MISEDEDLYLFVKINFLMKLKQNENQLAYKRRLDFFFAN